MNSVYIVHSTRDQKLVFQNLAKYTSGKAYFQDHRIVFEDGSWLKVVKVDTSDDFLTVAGWSYDQVIFDPWYSPEDPAARQFIHSRVRSVVPPSKRGAHLKKQPGKPLDTPPEQ